jgi:antitoxin ParD1/3/4
MLVRRDLVLPTRNINLTPEMDLFVDSKIQSGQYANASEVLRAGLRALEEDEQENQAKLQALRSAVQAGIDSGVAEGDVIGRVRARIRRRAEVTRRLTA